MNALRFLRAMLARLGGLFGKARRERELSAELESHLRLHIEDNLRAGLTPEQARRNALIKLGGIGPVKENYRDRRGIPMIETLIQDVRYGIRMLAKNPGFTIVAVLTLGLGIGANTAIFSLVQQILLRPLPYSNSERLIFMREHDINGNEMSVSYPSFRDWQQQSTLFEQIGAFRRSTANLTGGPAPERINLRMASWELFPTLGVKPFLGRLILPDDDRIGAPRVLVLSYDFWMQKFGGDTYVIGRPMELSGIQCTVVGVLPAGFELFQPVDVYLALGPSITGKSGDLDRGNHSGLSALGRLKPGASLESAIAEMDRITKRLEKDYPASNSGVRAVVLTLRKATVGDVEVLVWTLFGAVSFLLLIACVNVANLMLSHSLNRQKEIAIRGALGASRGRLVRQLMMESLLLALLGGGAGLLLAAQSMPVLQKLAEGTPRVSQLQLSLPLLAFTFALTALTAVLFGLMPALDLTRSGLSESLKLGSRNLTGGKFSRRFRGGLLVTEVALSLVLLAGAGLMIRTLRAIEAVPPGFQAGHLLSFQFTASGPIYNEARLRALNTELIEKVRAVPGVESAALTLSLPVDGSQWSSVFIVSDQPVPERAKIPSAAFIPSSTDYFKTMGIRLLRGRAFNEMDQDASQRVSIINQTMALKFWPNEDPIGKKVKQGWPEWNSPWREVVGVVEDVKLNGIDSPTPLEVFLPLAQEPSRGLFLVVRTSVPEDLLVKPIRDAVRAVDSQLPLFRARSMDEVISQSLSTRIGARLLLSVFAGIALLLAAIGLYGVISHGVGQRTQEIGIRMALGAQPRDVLRLILGEGAQLILFGLAAGIASAFALTHVLADQLYGVRPTDPATYAGGALLLAAVALFACAIPAWRAARVDPMSALRNE